MKNRKWMGLPLAVMASMILASCGGGGLVLPPIGGPGQPVKVFIPAAGAAVSSGNGTAIGTVRISPNATEIEMMNLVNEVRTKGTLNGEDVIKGSCVDGTFKPGDRAPLTFDGMLAHAARMHAVYMSTTGEYEHMETLTTEATFWATTPIERVQRSRVLAGQPANDGKAVGSENIVIRRTNATEATRSWVKSAGHCNNLMRPSAARMGMGYNSPGIFGSWVQMFAD